MKAPCLGSCGYDDEQTMIGDCARCGQRVCFGCEGGDSDCEDHPGTPPCDYDHCDLCAKCWCELHDEDTRAVRALERARELLARPDGWVQCWFRDDDGAHCVIGAVAEVCGRWTREDGMWPVGEGIINRVGDWNDTPGRTQAEVLSLIDRAIALGKAAP